jgi:hypothetical protein
VIVSPLDIVAENAAVFGKVNCAMFWAKVMAGFVGAA